MSILGGILAFAGLLISLIFGVILLIKAFQVHWGWGVASLLLPFANCVFAFTHWDIAKKPFLLMLVGAVISGIGYAILLPDMIEAMQTVN